MPSSCRCYIDHPSGCWWSDASYSSCQLVNRRSTHRGDWGWCHPCHSSCLWLRTQLLAPSQLQTWVGGGGGEVGVGWAFRGHCFGAATFPSSAPASSSSVELAVSVNMLFKMWCQVAPQGGCAAGSLCCRAGCTCRVHPALQHGDPARPSVGRLCCVCDDIAYREQAARRVVPGLRILDLLIEYTV